MLKIVTLTQIWTCTIYLLNVESCQLNVCVFGQGTYVEGIKEEVVLSPAHALSLIASGEGLIIVPLLSSFPSVLYLQLPLVYSVFSPCTFVISSLTHLCLYTCTYFLSISNLYAIPVYVMYLIYMCWCVSFYWIGWLLFPLPTTYFIFIS